MEKACVGLHTMKAEHFGITIVEMMAAGLITVAHNSAGPKYDIIQEKTVDQNGFLCDTEDEFADTLIDIFRQKI